MMVPCSHEASLFGKLDGYPEYDLKQFLYSKGRLYLDDEQEKFHPIEPVKENKVLHVKVYNILRFV